MHTPSLLVSHPPSLYFVVCLAEWSGCQGGEVKEATKGEEKQGQEGPRCKEGKEKCFILAFMVSGYMMQLKTAAYVKTHTSSNFFENLNRS